MRKGAFTTGKNTCNSMPVEALGCQLDPPTMFNLCEKLSFGQARHWPLTGSTAGQPKGNSVSAANWPGLIRNCEPLRIGSKPKSTKGAIATGPAIVILYSMFETRFKSPPGKEIWSTGTRTVYAGPNGLLGSLGTVDPSGLRSVIVEAVGRKATGEMDRISNPRRSFSPPE